MMYQFIFGLILLIIGAEALVRAASKLAELLGISPLIIGLTIVAFGTSSPELAVSIKSSITGQAGVAVGNVIGSNIFNVLFILGVSAMIAPLVVSRQLIRLEVPIMIVVSFLVYLFSLNNNIGMIEGIVLFLGILTYTIFQIYQSRNQRNNAKCELSPEIKINRQKSLIINLIIVLVGFIFLIIGSQFFVNGSVEIARALGVSELVIGLTIVAAGTSLPELLTSVLASIRGKCDLAVGNVVGSNIFNLLAVLGLSAIISPEDLNVSATALSSDLPVMIAAAVACLPVFFTGHLISRWEGLLFLGYYIIYMAYLFIVSQQHDALGNFILIMFSVVLPITVITFIIFTVRFNQLNKKSDVR